MYFNLPKINFEVQVLFLIKFIVETHYFCIFFLHLKRSASEIGRSFHLYWNRLQFTLLSLQAYLLHGKDKPGKHTRWNMTTWYFKIANSGKKDTNLTACHGLKNFVSFVHVQQQIRCALVSTLQRSHKKSTVWFKGKKQNKIFC